MCKLIFCIITTLLLSTALLPAHAQVTEGNCDGAERRAVLFLKNAHTGKKMNPKDWLADDVSRATMFAGFGGLNALIQQTTARTRKFGGLKSITIRNSVRSGDVCEVSAEVKFVKDPKDSPSPAATDNEDMVWTFQLSRQHRSWKIVR